MIYTPSVSITSASAYLDLVNADNAPRHVIAPAEVWLEILEAQPGLAPSIAMNRCLPDEILRLLASSPLPEVRTDIAMHHRLPSDVFNKLAKDEDESVRARIAWNKRAPETILQTLADDPEPVVSEPAKAQLAKRKLKNR